MTQPASRDLVLVGGGHSHALAVRMLAMKPIADTRITLVSPESLTPYSGMLPGWVAGHYSVEDSHIDLPRLCQWAGVRFVPDRVNRIDPERRRLILAEGPALDYDRVSLDLGATPSLDAVPGVREHAVPVKPVSSFRHRWKALLDELRPGEQPRIAVVGAGAGGTEMVLAVAHALGRQGIGGELHLIDSGALLPGYPERARAFMRRRLEAYGVSVHEDSPVTAVSENRLHLANDRIAFDFLLWCTGATGPGWLRDSELATTDTGLVRVDEHLRSISHDHVFAAGDCAWLDDHDLPRSGVHAVRQGPVLAENLRAACEDQPLRRYQPQKKTLSLLSAGAPEATGNRSAHWFQGAALWRLKDRIDRKFMTRFSELPERSMPAPEADDDPRCAGCGSKIGAEALRNALGHLDPVPNRDVRIGLDAGEDAAVIDWPKDRLLVQTQDYFPAFIDEPWLFGRIVALHAMSDAWAMNARPHSAVATVTVPVHHPRLQGRDLARLMQGAVAELNHAGCTLTGGHSLEGPQMGAGFTINAAATESELLHKRGARPGDALVLTKPLGTGLILAGLMRNRTKGPWLDGALAAMLTANADAAELLVEHGATACTDITGFGLIGHLRELCIASGVDAELLTGDVPLLEGAMALASEGLASSLAPANRAELAHCRYEHHLEAHPRLTVLTDPQTNGGLLATLPAENVEPWLENARRTGNNGHVIGRISEAGDAVITLQS
jgi:selenide,water dikinase